MSGGRRSVVSPNGSTVTLNVDSKRDRGPADRRGRAPCALRAGTELDLYLGGDPRQQWHHQFLHVTSTRMAILPHGAGYVDFLRRLGTWQLDRIDDSTAMRQRPARRPARWNCRVRPTSSSSTPPVFCSWWRIYIQCPGNSTATVDLAVAGNQTSLRPTRPTRISCSREAATRRQMPAPEYSSNLTGLRRHDFSGDYQRSGRQRCPAIYSNGGTFTPARALSLSNGAGAQTLGGTVASTFTNLRNQQGCRRM